jgi:hypothetical protein
MGNLEAADTSLETRLSSEESLAVAEFLSVDAAITSEISSRISGDASVLAAAQEDFKAIDRIGSTTLVDGTHMHVVANADNQTFTLPLNPSSDMMFYIKNFDGVDAQVTIAGNGKLIDGQSSIVLDVPNAAVKCVYDATAGGWFIF